MTEPDLARLDRLVEGEVAGEARNAPRQRREAGATNPRPVTAVPEWSRTLVGLLERLLERLDRLEGDVLDVGKRVDIGVDGLVTEIRRAVEPLSPGDDGADPTLADQVADLTIQVQALRAQVSELTAGLAELGVRRSPAGKESV